MPKAEAMCYGAYFREKPREWARLIVKGIRHGLVGLRKHVNPTCGSFFRTKSDGSLRWVFDGRRTNAQLVPPPDLEATTP